MGLGLEALVRIRASEGKGWVHRRTGSEIPGGSPLNSKSDGNSSPTEILAIRGLQRTLDSLR